MVHTDHKPSLPLLTFLTLTPRTPILSEPTPLPEILPLVGPSPAPEPQDHLLLSHVEPTCRPHFTLSQTLADQPRRYFSVDWALQTSNAHVRKPVAHAVSPTSEELPRSFGAGLGSLGLPGSQEKLAGRRTREQGFLGHVVGALPRPYFERALNSLGLQVSHSQCSAAFRIEFRFEQPAEWPAFGLSFPQRSAGPRGACREL